MGWRERLQQQGQPPDPRMSLANERTFLAWIRTSLAMIAGGVGLEAFAGDAFPTGVRVPLSVLLLLLGATLALGSLRRWHGVEEALRKGEDIPVTGLAPTIAAGVALTAAVLVLVSLILF